MAQTIKQGQPWLLCGWKTTKEVQGSNTEAGNNKPPLKISSLKHYLTALHTYTTTGNPQHSLPWLNHVTATGNPDMLFSLYSESTWLFLIKV